MTRTVPRLGFGSVDGVVALVLLAFGLSPGRNFQYAISNVISSHVTVGDCIFGMSFMFAWRYCFTLLNLYDKFAVVPSRLLATFQGVVIMMIPAAAYYKLYHPGALTFRSASHTALLLFVYEVNRSVFNVHLLDRLAARDSRRVIIIGSGRRAGKAWRAVRTRYRLSLRLLGFIDDRSADDMPPDIAKRYLGSLDDLDRIILGEVVDLMLIAMPIQSCYPLMQRAVHIAESAGVQVLYLDDIYSTNYSSRDANASLFRELAADQDKYLLFLATKRAVDIVGATIGLICLSPLLLGIVLVTKLTSKGPVLLRQQRYGYRRKRFEMLKFRSIVYNPKHILPELQDVNEATLKKYGDPRFAPLGRRLRRVFLEELPQLWNVLMGDMSLVGPRPMSVRDVALFDKASLTRRFSVRPGITGLWQVSGRNSIGSDYWIEMDNRYIDDRSLVKDAKILVRTIGVVIKGSEAM